jgi:hypothetical protein
LEKEIRIIKANRIVMNMRFYLIIIATTIILPSCLKQSIPDAMMNKSVGQNGITATLSYEINGKLVTISVKDADNQSPGFRRLSCEKSNVYVLSGVGDDGEFVFTFFTDSLRVGNYKYTGNYGPMYVTTFEGKPQYVYFPADNMNFNVTTYKDGHFSGNFSGQLTPAISQGNPNNVYGAAGSVLIKNGSFTNVPVVY